MQTQYQGIGTCWEKFLVYEYVESLKKYIQLKGTPNPVVCPVFSDCYSTLAQSCAYKGIIANDA